MEKNNALMHIKIHSHAAQRAIERGATKDEIIEVVENGEQFPAKFDRIGFRKNFLYESNWNNQHYETKQIEAYCVKVQNEWLVLTVIVKFF